MNPDTIALLHGPLVLAADLGPAEAPFDGVAPALVAADVVAGVRPTAEPAVYRTHGIGRPADLRLEPFFRQYDRRTAVYFRRFSEGQWTAEQARLAAERNRMAALEARSADVMKLGDEAAEKAHGLTSKTSYAESYRGRGCRDARTGGFFEFRMKDRPGSAGATGRLLGR